MAAPLQPEPLIHRRSKFARPDLATLRKQPGPSRGSMRLYSCLWSRMALTGTPYKRCRAETFENIDHQNLAAVSGNDLVADHLLTGIVPALYQHAWLDPRDQLDRRVFFKSNDQVDRLQRRQHFRARALVLYRTAVALEALHGCIAVQPDDQPVAGAARRGQHLDVTRMQNIKTAIGESDPQALLAPIQKLRVELAAGRDDLLFRGKESMR